MKRTLLFSSSISLAMVMALTGCNSNTNSGDRVSISGKAIDPYLQNATVYADTNGNGKQDANEPAAISDENGSYVLNVSDANDTYTLYVSGGKDTVTGEDFNGTLSTVVTGIRDAAESNLTANISPLTTLVAIRYHELNETISDTKEDVANYLDLNLTEIDADIVKLANDLNDTKAFKTAFALEKAAEHYASEHNTTTVDFYRNIAHKSTDSNAGSWVDDINQTDLIKGIMNADGDDVSELLENAGFHVPSRDHNSTTGAADQDAGNAGEDTGSEDANATDAPAIPAL